MLAASTASAPPSAMPSARCCERADAARRDHRHRHRVATPRASARGRSRSWCRRGPCWSAGFRRRRARPSCAPIRPRRGRCSCARRACRRPSAALRLPPTRASRRSRRRCTARRTCPTRRAIDLRIRDRRRIEADLVGAGVEQPPHVFDRAHAAADRQRNEHLRRHRLDDRQDQVALVAGGGDVEEGEFVGALLVVAARRSRPDRRRRAVRRS